MPKDQPSVDELIQRAEMAGAALGEKATALSELIDHIGQRLQQIPGKVVVSHASDGIELTFGRQSNTWGLWLIDSDSPNTMSGIAASDLTRVSISRKARAFPLLLKLLSAISAEQTRQIAEIDEAVKLLEDEPSLVRAARKEGK